LKYNEVGITERRSKTPLIASAPLSDQACLQQIAALPQGADASAQESRTMICLLLLRIRPRVVSSA
jgi:hypothetical protein